MKILLVSSSSGSHGGGEFYLRELATALDTVGHNVTTWLARHPQMDKLAAAFRDRKLQVRRFEYQNTYHRKCRSIGAVLDRSLCRQLAVEFETSNADVVHLNQQCLEDGLDLVKAAAVCRIPSVSTIHVTRSARSLGARGAFVRDFVCRKVLSTSAIPLVGVSRTSASDLCEFLFGHRHLSVPAIVTDIRSRTTSSSNHVGQPVYAVANGVARPYLKDAGDLKSSLGLKPSDTVLGVIARIEQQKNPLFMCRLLKLLPATVHCVWVGDGRLRSTLEDEIVRLSLEQRFHLVGWQDDASGWLAAFDVFVLGSLFEGLPLALLESMAAGLPCVVSKVDGTQDAIQNCEDGFLCPVNDVDTWISVLTSLIELPELRASIGQAARKRYETEFSLEAMANRMVAVYHDVINRFQSPAHSRQ